MSSGYDIVGARDGGGFQPPGPPPPPCMIHLISDFTLGWLPLGLGVVVYSLHYCSAVCIRQLLGVHIVQKSGL